MKASTIIIALCATTAMAQNTAGNGGTAESMPQDTAKVQSDTPAKELKGVTVRGSRIVNRPDGKTIYPSEEQKNNSATVYGLLQKIALPDIRADEARQTISALSNRGGIEIRINGIPADNNQLVATDCRDITRIEYTDKPGVRYGEGTGYVINFIVRRASSGCSAGVNTGNTLTAARGNNSAFGKVNRGKSQWEASYSMGYGRNEGNRGEQTTDYTMPDNSIYTISSVSTGDLTKWTSHNATLTYNRADSGRYELQVRAGGSIARTPVSEAHYRSMENGTPHGFTTSNTSRSLSPSADIYWHRDMAGGRNITANAAWSLIRSDISNYHDNGGPYRYDIDGRAQSLIAEGIYEARMRPFTLSAGMRWQLKSVRNTYTGDIASTTDMTTSNAYAFGQITGELAGISYTAGVGLSHTDFRMSPYSYSFFTMRPKLSLSYPLTDRLKIAYDFELSQHTSAIANTNDITIRRNSVEREAGNPSIRPNRVFENTLTLSWQAPRLYAQMLTMYRTNPHCNMKRYDRETDGDGNTVFVMRQTNQKGIDMLMWQGYANWSVIEGKFDVSAAGTVLRCINKGDDYLHTHTAFNGSATLTAYLGRFTLSAYADNGWGFMEGETRARLDSAVSLSASYRLKRLNIALHWQNPLTGEVLKYENELDSRYIRRSMRGWSSSDANMLTLSVRYTFSHGRKFNDISRRIDNRDSDAGILR